MRRRIGRRKPDIVTGLILIAVGTVFLLANAHVIRLERVWRLWPLFLVAAGLGRLLFPTGRSRGWGLIELLTGLLFLGIQYNWKGLHWFNAWPIMIMILGIGFIVDGWLRPGRERLEETEEDRHHV